MLLEKKFLQADYETFKKMFWIINKGKNDFFDKEDFNNFPSVDLKTIDKLWLSASDGKFGFSVQKKNWIDIKNTSKFNIRFGLWKRLEDKLNWKKDEFVWDLRALRGHLPVIVYINSYGSVDINRMREIMIQLDEEKQKEHDDKEREIINLKKQLKELEKKGKELSIRGWKQGDYGLYNSYEWGKLSEEEKNSCDVEVRYEGNGGREKTRYIRRSVYQFLLNRTEL